MTLMTFPARALKDGFEFLDDFAVAAHGAVEALKVAIDDPDEVVENSRARQALPSRASPARRFHRRQQRPRLWVHRRK